MAIIEKESLGGVCLNWVCIPTKALLKSAQVYEYLKHSADYGIQSSGVQHDFTAVVRRSRGVADKMSKGVQFLMKKNKIDVVMGFGKVAGKGKVLVTAADVGLRVLRHAVAVAEDRPARAQLVEARPQRPRAASTQRSRDTSRSPG